MKKYVAASAVLLMLGVGSVFADDDRGFTATIDIDANALQITKNTYSDENDRPHSHSTSKTQQLPFGGFDFLTDSAVDFSFSTDFWGGKVSLDDKDGLGGFKVWAAFGPFVKLTVGDDIGSSYADSLDADPGMRVYTGTVPLANDTGTDWDANKDPDNITQDKGILLELFFKPVTLAFAGQYYDGDVLSLEILNSEHTEWVDVEQKKYGYGVRVGSEIWEWGKVNASYILQYNNIGSNNYRLDRERKAQPAVADAERTTHLFGIYASLTPPLAGLGVSLGYGGVYTKYVDEFYRGTGMVETLVPSVFQSGYNLNARYKGIDRLTLRTDHNVSLWTDRDYTAFGIPGRGNYGLLSDVESAAFADVSHFFLWNGLGAEYKINDSFKVSLYARNLYREDSAEQENADVWEVTKDKFALETKFTYMRGDKFEVYAGVTFETTASTATKTVNQQISNKFATWAEVKDTSDVETLIKIPVGITVKL
jgi:hypothetical protein